MVSHTVTISMLGFVAIDGQDIGRCNAQTPGYQMTYLKLMDTPHSDPVVSGIATECARWGWQTTNQLLTEGLAEPLGAEVKWL